MRPGIDLQGKRVLVVGLARTGVVTSLFSAGYGAIVTATDEKPEPELAEVAAKLRAAGVKLELGAPSQATFLEQDLIVLSPGVPAKLPPFDSTAVTTASVAAAAVVLQPLASKSTETRNGPKNVFFTASSTASPADTFEPPMKIAVADRSAGPRVNRAP